MELQVYLHVVNRIGKPCNYDFGRTTSNVSLRFISPGPKNETTNFAKKTRTMTKIMKARAQALSAKREIRLVAIVMDAFPPEADAIDAITQAPSVSGATLQAPNAVGAIELERNTSVEEHELAPHSDALVGLLRSNCPPRERAFRGCGEIVPGQTFWAESVAPTKRIAPAAAVGGSQSAFHVRPLPAAKNGSAYRDCNPDCKMMPAVRENSTMDDYPAVWSPRANHDFVQLPPNSTAPCASCFADLKLQVSQEALSLPLRASPLAPRVRSPAPLVLWPFASQR
jgi:hypothetical protein